MIKNEEPARQRMMAMHHKTVAEAIMWKVSMMTNKMYRIKAKEMAGE